ncbi:MAG: GNAT family N-acetyltransferase [Myxococcota bacterium]
MKDWIAAGGDPNRLGLYRRVLDVEPLVDASGRCLVFANGAIGDFTGGPTLLAAAERRLRERGVREAIGPLDGNTFFPYRASLGPTDDPPFLGEPLGKPDVWRGAGWREDARYLTTSCPNEAQIAYGEGAAPDFTVRNLRMDHLLDEVRALYEVTCASFAGAWRYEALPFEVFAALYLPLKDRIDPRWVWLAEDRDGRVRGYSFTWPEGKRFVIKTLAVHPEVQRARLGARLMAAAHGFAAAQGVPEGLHALMWEGSYSTAITKHGGRAIRRYALYRKRL